MDSAPIWLSIPLSLLFALVLFDTAWRTAAVLSRSVLGNEPVQQRRKSATWGMVRLLLLAAITWGVGNFGLAYLPGILNWVVAGTLVSIGLVVGVRASLSTRLGTSQPPVPNHAVREKS